MSETLITEKELLETKQDLEERLQELNDSPSRDESEIASITEQIKDVEKKINVLKAKKTSVEPGTENLVHAMITFGNRFSAKTGKEINKPKRMMFSYGEWLLFKQSYKRLGYTITEIVNNPFDGNADESVETN